MNNGWDEWGQKVLSDLERLNINYEKMGKDVQDIKLECAQIKLRSGWTHSLYGIIGGAIPAGIIIAWIIIKGV